MYDVWLWVSRSIASAIHVNVYSQIKVTISWKKSVMVYQALAKMFYPKAEFQPVESSTTYFGELSLVA